MCSMQSMRDKLTGALIGLARATDGNEHLISEASTAVIVESLYATLPGVNYSYAALEKLLERVEQEKRLMVPDCFTCASPCGKNNDYDMANLWNADEAVRSLKILLLSDIRSAAAYACEAAKFGYHEREVDAFFYKALIAVGIDDWEVDRLLPIVLEAGSVSLKCMTMPEEGKNR